MVQTMTSMRMKANYATVIPVIDGLSIDKRREFLKRIQYSNAVMNLDGGDIDHIFSDRTVTTPLFFMAQYYGSEINLYGGIRIIKSHILLMQNFNSKF